MTHLINGVIFGNTILDFLCFFIKRLLLQKETNLVGRFQKIISLHMIIVLGRCKNGCLVGFKIIVKHVGDQIVNALAQLLNLLLAGSVGQYQVAIFLERGYLIFGEEWFTCCVAHF